MTSHWTVALFRSWPMLLLASLAFGLTSWHSGWHWTHLATLFVCCTVSAWVIALARDEAHEEDLARQREAIRLDFWERAKSEPWSYWLNYGEEPPPREDATGPRDTSRPG